MRKPWWPLTREDYDAWRGQDLDQLLHFYLEVSELLEQENDE